MDMCPLSNEATRRIRRPQQTHRHRTRAADTSVFGSSFLLLFFFRLRLFRSLSNSWLPTRAASWSAYSFTALSSSSFLLAASAATARKRSEVTSTVSPDTPDGTGRLKVKKPTREECRRLRSLLCGPSSARTPGRAYILSPWGVVRNFHHLLLGPGCLRSPWGGAGPTDGAVAATSAERSRRVQHHY